ncbi:sodium-coupled monocarboxylate transporter 2 isoform X2 [Lasioglossum baleicum]|uniref:sodium-coupled monocarboxylate transporter 2 isoform X2 n=1 Tax=Lasioglossum baleicum TaxID=434251 RepID=UPI003FCEAF02
MADANDPTHKTLDLIDCAVFAGMLGISAIIGVYHAYKSRKSTDAVREYLVGGQNMSIFPISMSLIASYISGISILGLPAEMYVYGTQFWCVVIADSFVSLTMAFVYLPVFYGLGITSSYEVLALGLSSPVSPRENSKTVLRLSVLEAEIQRRRSSDGLRDISDQNAIIHPTGDIRSGAGFQSSDWHQSARDRPVGQHGLHILHDPGKKCARQSRSIEQSLYRCNALSRNRVLQGGLKAVVWTDAVQTIVMFGGVVLVAVYGTIRVGGIDFVWEKNRETNRIEFFNFDMDPTTRHTFWSVVIGNYLNWLATCSVNQAMVQRCLSMPNLKMANATIVIMAIGIITIVSLNCYTGLVLFAAFHDCDPVKTKQIGKSDQLLPFFVMELAASIPGLPGLFVACVFSAALSTMSTGLNSMAGVIFEDMIRPYLRGPVSDVAASRTMKATVVVIGAICVGLVFLVEKLGGLIQAGKSLSGITAGPLLGMFTLGMFFPSANSAVSQSIAQFPHRRSLHLCVIDSLSLLYPSISRSLSLFVSVFPVVPRQGAIVGGLLGLNLVAWISFGTQAAISTGEIVFPQKPVSIEGCSESLKNRAGNSTLIIDPTIQEHPFLLYRMSYLWYTWVGFLTAILVGLLVSWITGSNRRKPGDEKLYTPMIRRFLRSTVIAGAENQQDVTKLEKLEMNATGNRVTRNPP